MEMGGGKMQNILNIRKTTVSFLAIFAVLLGLWSVALDFKLINYSMEMETIIAFLFMGIVISEIGFTAITKRQFGALEIIGLSAVGLTALATVFGFLGITSQVLSGFAGSVKLMLIIIAIAMVFSKQKGE